MPLTDMQHVGAEYLLRTFRQQGFYTIGLPEKPADEQPPNVRAFQVVWIVSPSAKILRRPDELKTPSLDLGIQRLEARKFVEDPPLLEVFAVGEVVHVDGLKLAEWRLLRHELKEWKATSERAGCTCLEDRQRAQPKLTRLGLADPSVPIFLVIEELQRTGWRRSTPERIATPITEPTPSVWSFGKVRCRPYLQCVLFLPSLFEKGLKRLTHSAATSYYALLLRSDRPGEVPTRGKASAYHSMLLSAAAQSEMPLPATGMNDFVFSDDEGPAMPGDLMSESPERPGALVCAEDSLEEGGWPRRFRGQRGRGRCAQRRRGRRRERPQRSRPLGERVGRRGQ